MAYSSSGEFAHKSNRRFSRKLDAPFIAFRIAHLKLITENGYLKSFCKYLKREIYPNLFNSERG